MKKKIFFIFFSDFWNSVFFFCIFFCGFLDFLSNFFFYLFFCNFISFFPIFFYYFFWDLKKIINDFGFILFFTYFFMWFLEKFSTFFFSTFLPFLTIFGCFFLHLCFFWGGGLESSGQRLISSIGKTNGIYIFNFFFGDKKKFKIFRCFEKNDFFNVFFRFLNFKMF